VVLKWWKTWIVLKWVEVRSSPASWGNYGENENNALDDIYMELQELIAWF
jgi:hypothetical protein